MKISFDLDGTLFVEDPALALPDWFNYVEPYKVSRLRRGAPELFAELTARGWEAVFYTKSLRSRKSLLAWALMRNWPVVDVINQQIHENRCAELGVYPCSVAPKMPHWFGIDLHVDDSPQVAEAGLTHGFPVCLVDTTDPDWGAKVLARADELAPPSQ